MIPWCISAQPEHLPLFILPRSCLEMLLILQDTAKTTLFWKHNLAKRSLVYSTYPSLFLWSCCFYVSMNKVWCISLLVVVFLLVCIIAPWLQKCFKVPQTSPISYDWTAGKSHLLRDFIFDSGKTQCQWLCFVHSVLTQLFSKRSFQGCLSCTKVSDQIISRQEF